MPIFSNHSVKGVFVLFLFLFSCDSPAVPVLPASGWIVEKQSVNWSSRGFSESRDLSGIASLDGKNFLVGSDELTSAQLGEIDLEGHTLVAGDLLPLLPVSSESEKEIDIEGVAAIPSLHRYYVTGSHAAGKKSGKLQENRASVFQISCDPKTGAILPESIQRASLMPWFIQNTLFREYAQQPLPLNGLNIEGLTARGESLYFGLRAPNLQGHTYVIEVAANTLFGADIPPAIVHQLAVGEARGIRELVAIRDGFLVLTGKSHTEANAKKSIPQNQNSDSTFDLFLWRPGRDPVLSTLGPLPSPSGKAEAILLLADTDAYVDILVLFDGALEGDPQSYRLTRP